MSGARFLGWAEEPRAQGDPLDPFYDVVPVPFYPDDLPYVDWSDNGFSWSQQELNEALATARVLLFERSHKVETT